VVRRTDPKPAPKMVPKPSSKPQGNGNVNATRGVATSSRSQPGGQAQTTGGSAKVQGNAAASNYAGLVMRRIQRAKRRADVRGEALVRFSITSGGGVAAVSLARSSGSGKLDGIALAQVRRAAPFPPPPPGARTSFTVRIKGK
jgi:protein TonB